MIENSMLLAFIGIFIGILALGISVATFLIWSNRQRLETRKVKAELSMVREYLDQRLEEVNHAVSSSYELWNDVNRLLVEAQPSAQSKFSSSDNFLSRLGVKVEIIQQKPRQALLLMPIMGRHQALFLALKEACNASFYKPVRSDETYVEGNLLARIVELILESEVIICDISARNPNVFYELGIAHAFNKQVIIISEQKEAEKFPFDVQSNRILLYRNPFELTEPLKIALQEIKQKSMPRS